MKKVTSYTITLTEEQLQLISQACEFTSRFLAGQVSVSFWPGMMLHHREFDINSPDYLDRKQAMEILMRQVAEIGWKKDYGHGCGYDKRADVLFEAYQVMRHELWKSLPEEQRSTGPVWSYPPSLNTSGLPFVKCEPVNEQP
jgi:hypothetical protein